MKVIEGKLVAKGIKVCIVAARLNDFITKRLFDGAVDALVRRDCPETNIDIVWVPGSFEIPVVTKKVCSTKKYDGVICIGTVIKGDTPHNEYIASEVTKGIAMVSLESGVPVSFGVLTTDNVEQAIERAGTKAGNKGSQAAEALIETINVLKQL
jgi:6,7-dimethyl-8-ribityllumazine synthase